MILGLVKKKSVDGYIDSLKIKDGKVTFDNFKDFVRILDTVLVDIDGNVLDNIEEKHRAVDLDDLLEE